MKTKGFIRLASCYMLLTLAVLFVSWIGSIYDWQGVQNLLSPEGLRWALRSLADNYLHSPVLLPALILFFGAGLWADSGLGQSLWRVCSGKHSLFRKERRGLWMALVMGGIYVAACGVLAWGPWGIVRNVIGTLEDSPLAKGIWCVISLGMSLMAIVYACVADYYRSDKDIVRGMSCLFVRRPTFFVTLFFVTLFFSALDYTHLLACVGVPDGVFRAAYLVCSLLPLIESPERK